MARGENQARDSVRVLRRVCDGKARPSRVRQNAAQVKAQVLPQLLNVGSLRPVGSESLAGWHG